MRASILTIALALVFASTGCMAPPSVASLPPTVETSAPLRRAAQDPGTKYGPSKGESEIRIGASILSQEQRASGVGTIETSGINTQLGFGYLVDEMIEFGGQLLLSFFRFKAPGSPSMTSGSAGIFPYVRANFRTSPRSWFYAGVHAGILNFEAAGDTSTSFSYGIHGGFKTWITPAVSFFIEPRFTRSELEFANSEFTLNELNTIMGLGFTF